jgi:GNAT superfamily N-acetyltransferase
MADNPTFTIRLMKPDDMDQALNLSISEGWNQTANDWRLLLENPGNRCIIAEKDNRVAGTATALNHSGKVAWIGMVLVDPSLRGQGAGKMLLTNIIDKIRHSESVKLDATPAGEPLYRKLGFLPEYKIFRMTRASLDFVSDINDIGTVYNTDMSVYPELVRIDGTIFGAGRSYLLTKLFQYYPEKAFYHLANEKVDGYAYGRDGTRFNYIGPVNATSSATARALIARALKNLDNQPVALDILEDKEDLIRWLESIGFVKQRHFLRMYLKDNPYPGIPDNQYLISGPEFG